MYYLLLQDVRRWTHSLCGCMTVTSAKLTTGSWICAPPLGQTAARLKLSIRRWMRSCRKMPYHGETVSACLLIMLQSIQEQGTPSHPEFIENMPAFTSMGVLVTSSTTQPNRLVKPFWRWVESCVLKTYRSRSLYQVKQVVMLCGVMNQWQQCIVTINNHVLQVCGFDPEDLAVDVGLWFKGSTNRKGYLTGMYVQSHEVQIKSRRAWSNWH